MKGRESRIGRGEPQIVKVLASWMKSSLEESLSGQKGSGLSTPPMLTHWLGAAWEELGFCLNALAISNVLHLEADS